MSRTLAAPINLYWAVAVDGLLPASSPTLIEARAAILEAENEAAKPDPSEIVVEPPEVRPAAKTRTGCPSIHTSGVRCRFRVGHQGKHRYYNSGMFGLQSTEWD